MNDIVTYACPFVPPELIAAQGLEPRRLVSRRWSQQMPQAEGLCPFVRAYCGGALQEPPALAIFTTLCDQMRRGWERAAGNTFLLHVPKTLGPAAEKFYRQELERLAQCLGGISGRQFDRQSLADAMRARIERPSSPCGWLDPAASGRPDGSSPPVPLALAGGPLMQEDYELLDLVAQFGGQVVRDATDGGAMFAPSPFNDQALDSDPMGELARAYFAIAHPARRPNDGFHERMQQEARRLGIRGIILRRYVWCDLWHAELASLREQFQPGRDPRGTATVPVLDLDVDGQGQDAARLRGRLQAFLEVLRGR